MAHRKLLVVLALCATGVDTYAQDAPRYRFERIPTEAPSCENSARDASDLNNAGAVIGRRCISSEFASFVVHNGAIRLLPPNETAGADRLWLNDRFDVLVSAQSAGRVVLLRNDGTVVEVSPLPNGNAFTALAFNNRRQVLSHSFIWERGRVRRLSALPDTHALNARGINDHGVAIGYSSSAPSERAEDQRAVLWMYGTVMKLPLPDGALGSRGVDINNRGQAVFTADFDESTTEPQRERQSYVWKQGRLTALPLLPFPSDTLDRRGQAIDINNRGEIVGFHSNRAFQDELLESRATLWRDGAVYELQDLLVDENGAPVTNLILEQAVAINDAGQILVAERPDFLFPDYYLLTPVTPANTDVGEQ